LTQGVPATRRSAHFSWGVDALPARRADILETAKSLQRGNA